MKRYVLPESNLAALPIAKPYAQTDYPTSAATMGAEVVGLEQTHPMVFKHYALAAPGLGLRSRRRVALPTRSRR